METTFTLTKSPAIIRRLVLFAALFLVVFPLSVLYLLLVIGGDWLNAYLPACQELLAGRSPYNQFNFFNPPWALLPLLPLALLPAKVGSVILSVTNVLVFAGVAHRLGAKPIVVLLIATLPPVLYSTNIDWMVALGLILPPQIGLFFVLVKPQVGIFVALFWFVQTSRRGLRETVRVFAPVTIVFILSLLIFGPYPLKSVGQLSQIANPWNAHIFPYGVPVGLALLGAAVRGKRAGYAATAAPFLSPYSLLWSWPVALLGLLPDTAMTVLAVVGVWMIDLTQTHLGSYILSMLRH